VKKHGRRGINNSSTPLALQAVFLGGLAFAIGGGRDAAHEDLAGLQQRQCLGFNNVPLMPERSLAGPPMETGPEATRAIVVPLIAPPRIA
jgi:hypothetical protein